MARIGAGDLNSGMRCIKYFLIVINLLFVTTSVLMITVGRTVQSIFGDFSEFLDAGFTSASTLLIASGCIMLVVSAFGVVGAFRESTMLTNMYALLLLAVFVLEVSAAILATCLQGEVGTMLVHTMYDTLNAYPTNPYAAQAIDLLQDKLECCGVKNLEDWEFVLPLPADASNSTIMVPKTCCRQAIGEDSCDEYIMEGCLNRLEFVISQSTVIIAMGSISVAFVQILGVVSALMLAKTIRRTKSLREARRWQMQQSLGIVIGGGGGDSSNAAGNSKLPPAYDYSALHSEHLGKI